MDGQAEQASQGDGCRISLFEHELGASIAGEVLATKFAGADENTCDIDCLCSRYIAVNAGHLTYEPVAEVLGLTDRYSPFSELV